MLASRKRIESGTPEDQRYQLDEFLAAFQVDRLAVAQGATSCALRAWRRLV